MSDIYRRCGCRDDQGRQLGAACDRLADPKHGSWTYYLAAGIDPKSGRRRQIRQSGFRTKQDAQRARNEAATKVDKGTYVPPTNETLADYLGVWIARRSRANELKASTLRMYERYIADDLAPSAIGRTRLTDLRRFHVSAFVAALTEDGRGATTVRRIVAVLRAALADAARDDRIEDNPARGVRLPTEDKEQFEPWEPDQVGLFLDTAATHRLGDLFTVAVFTGMRRGELIGLRWSDVDLTRRVLTVRTARVQVGDTVVETTPKSQSSRRVLELDDATVGALVSWRLHQDGERDAWGGAWDDGGWVFTYEDGRPLRPAYVSRLFETVRDRAGLVGLSFHGMRHLHASLLLASGTDIAIVSKRLGHSTLALTSDVYSHLIASASRRAAEGASALVPRAASAHTVHTQDASAAI